MESFTFVPNCTSCLYKKLKEYRAISRSYLRFYRQGAINTSAARKLSVCPRTNGQVNDKSSHNQVGDNAVNMEIGRKDSQLRLRGSDGSFGTPNVAHQRYYGRSGVWGSPFPGDRWKDASAWIHHGSVYDWRGPGVVSRFATLQEIKKAFRRIILRTHPDIHGLNTNRESIHDIMNAYHILRNPVTRAEYDRYLECHGNGYVSSPQVEIKGWLCPSYRESFNLNK
eukprot:jgi/Galph1/4107/GphlegSOOS_G2791.1